MKRGIHIYSSFTYFDFFGIERNHHDYIPNEVYDARVHPDDLRQLQENGKTAIKLLNKLPVNARHDFKMITEYRIRNKKGQYILVTEQHHVLELDLHGNLWLSLGILDIAPNQNSGRGLSFQIMNYRTNELIEPTTKNNQESSKLTLREKEILEMVRKGKLSKEISHLLSISVHTVNTHRQRILEKLNAGNAMEALLTAKKRGIIA